MKPPPPPVIPPVPSSAGVRPFWSVMIPTHRPDDSFMRQTIESVLEQDPGRDQMQIVLFDDGSPGGAPAGFSDAVTMR